MALLCKLRHKKYKYAYYEEPAEPGTVVATGIFEVVNAWTYFHDERCKRCTAKWIDGERVE